MPHSSFGKVAPNQHHCLVKSDSEKNHPCPIGLGDIGGYEPLKTTPINSQAKKDMVNGLITQLATKCCNNWFRGPGCLYHLTEVYLHHNGIDHQEQADDYQD